MLATWLHFKVGYRTSPGHGYSELHRFQICRLHKSVATYPRDAKPNQGGIWNFRQTTRKSVCGFSQAKQTMSAEVK